MTTPNDFFDDRLSGLALNRVAIEVITHDPATSIVDGESVDADCRGAWPEWLRHAAV